MARCCDFNAGMLREPVTFQRGERESDGAGGFIKSWRPVSGASEWAHVKAVSGGERLASDRIEAITRWRITVRYFAGLLESDRVQFRGRVYNIRFVNNIELRDEWLQIDLDAGVAV